VGRARGPVRTTHGAGPGVNAVRFVRQAAPGLALALASLCGAAPAAATELRPNIVLVVVDDWGFTDPGAFGGEIATPHIDTLARRGVRFANFHVAASCSPTRATLLTGLEHHRAGIGNLRETTPRSHQGQPGYLGSLAPGVVSVATRLRAAGYRSYISGKWNLGSEPHNLPPRHGFARSLVQGDTGSDNFDPMQRYLPHSATVQWIEDGQPARMPAAFYSSEYFTDRMLQFLQANAGSTQPFFAVLAFQANHVPLQAPQAYLQRQEGKYLQGWEALRRQRTERAIALGLLPPGTAVGESAAVPDWDRLGADEQRGQARRMQAYAAMAEAMDHELGRVVAHLESRGELDRTVFVFLSDNGPEGSDYREARPWLATQYSMDPSRLGGPGTYAIPGPGWASASAGPLAGYKFYAGEGGLRVPLVVAGVPGAQAGAIHHGFTHVLDVVPTLLELAGLPPDPALPGRSLLPALREPAVPLRAAEEGLGYELSGNSAYFQGRWKLVRNLPPGGDGQWHLYDLQADPGETRDLQSTQPEVFNALRQRYEAWAQAQGVLPMPEGYSPQRQVLINTLFNYWLPHYGPAGAAASLGLAAAFVLWRRRRRAS